MKTQGKTSNSLGTPSEHIKHLDETYELVESKSWNEKGLFHLELVMRETSFSKVAGQMDLSRTVKAPKNFNERGSEI